MSRFDDIAAELDSLHCPDPEKDHRRADDLLLAAVPQQVRDAYQRLVERAPWWAHA